MLAKKLNAASRARKPICLRFTTRDLTSDPNKVSAALADFLASLTANLQPSPFPLNLADFFRDLHLPAHFFQKPARLSMLTSPNWRASRAFVFRRLRAQMASPDYIIASFLPSCFLI